MGKIYVKVIADFDFDGTIVPRCIIWADGRVFQIDRVLEVDRVASIKGGGIGTRFTVRIQGKIRTLWFENPAWFVERI